jgi:hypothetical protein
MEDIIPWGKDDRPERQGDIAQEFLTGTLEEWHFLDEILIESKRHFGSEGGGEFCQDGRFVIAEAILPEIVVVFINPPL